MCSPHGLSHSMTQIRIQHMTLEQKIAHLLTCISLGYLCCDFIYMERGWRALPERNTFLTKVILYIRQNINSWIFDNPRITLIFYMSSDALVCIIKCQQYSE